jgi:nitrite reductase/ring-hydroxylating ferredoxin subunit
MVSEADLSASLTKAVSGYGIFQCAYPFNGDANDVSAGEGEVVCWDDSCAGHEEDAIGEAVVTEEILGEYLGIAFQFREGSCAGEGDGFVAFDLKLDGGCARERI